MTEETPIGRLLGMALQGSAPYGAGLLGNPIASRGLAGLLGTQSFAQRMAAMPQPAPADTARGMLSADFGQGITADDPRAELAMALSTATPRANLPMNTASRMQRATEQGWTRRVYHGTDRDFPEFAYRPSSEPGHFVSPNPEIAGYYPFSRGDRAVDETGRNVIPMMLRGNLFDVSAPVSDDALAVWRQAIASRYAESTRQNAMREFDSMISNAPIDQRGATIDRFLRLRAGFSPQDLLRQQGYIGVDRGPEIQVYDPASFRSVHAAFDPARRDSSDLLASIVGLLAMSGAGYGMLSPTQAPQNP